MSSDTLKPAPRYGATITTDPITGEPVLVWTESSRLRLAKRAQRARKQRADQRASGTYAVDAEAPTERHRKGQP